MKAEREGKERLQEVSGTQASSMGKWFESLIQGLGPCPQILYSVMTSWLVPPAILCYSDPAPVRGQPRELRIIYRNYPYLFGCHILLVANDYNRCLEAEVLPFGDSLFGVG
jgi:hypothetical protein